MDPCTILGLTGTVTSILDVVARSLSSLAHLVSRYNNAASSVDIISSQLSMLRLGLNQLLQWLRFGPSNLESNTTLMSDLRTSISGCELLIRLLDTEIQKLYDSRNSPMSKAGKIQFAVSEMTFRERQTQLNHHVTFLTFLLQAINCRTIAEQEKALNTAETRRAESAIQDDVLSLRESLRSQEPSLASTLSSRRSSMSNIAFDFERDTGNPETSNLLGPRSGGTWLMSQSTNNETQPSGSHVSNIDTGSRMTSQEATGLQKAFKRLSVKARLQKPFRGLAKASVLPAMKVTQETQSIEEPKFVDQPAAFKAILVGASSSGKSTLLESFRSMLNQEVRKPVQLLSKRLLIDTFMERVIGILHIMGELGIEFENDHSFRLNESCFDSSNYPQIMHQLWMDSGFRKAAASVRKHYVPKDTAFLFANAERLSSETVFHDEEALRFWNRSTGIYTYEQLPSASGRPLVLADHSGVRSERKKWTRYFDQVQAVIFTVDITCWHRALFEDHDADEMQESLELFEAIANSRWFERSMLLLVFTHFNSLAKKLEEDPLSGFDSTYRGGTSTSAALDHISTSFKQLIRSPASRTLQIITTDIDDGVTSPARKVFDALHVQSPLISSPTSPTTFLDAEKAAMHAIAVT